MIPGDSLSPVGHELAAKRRVMIRADSSRVVPALERG